MNRTQRVSTGVKRQRLAMLGQAVAVDAPRVFFLQVCAVAQQHVGQVARRSAGKDRAAVAALDQHWQEAAVVEVGMAQHHRVEAGRIEWQRQPVALAVQFESLEQAAVEQDARACELDQVLGPGDAVGGAVAEGSRVVDTDAQVAYCSPTTLTAPS